MVSHPVLLPADAGIRIQFQEKSAVTADEYPAVSGANSKSVGCRTGDSIPFTPFSLEGVVGILCNNSKGKPNYAIILGHWLVRPASVRARRLPIDSAEIRGGNCIRAIGWHRKPGVL